MFGGSMMNQFEEDPFFRDHFAGMRQMHQSMNQMMQGFGGVGLLGADPFNTVPAIGFSQTQPAGAQPQRNRQVAMANRAAANPFGSMFADMNRMMGGFGGMMGNMQRQMESAGSDPNSHFYSQSSVMTFSNTGQGPPKVFQASTSTHQAPGGVRETRRAVRDSGAGIEKMAIGHHIRDRGHVIERKRDARTGEHEENQELINLDDDDRDTFDREFREKMGAYNSRRPGGHHHHAVGGGGGGGGAGRPDRHRPRAITQEGHNHRHRNRPSEGDARRDKKVRIRSASTKQY